jgi:hypothetical protein
MVQIIIEVRGGVVQSVATNTENVEILIRDFDNEETGEPDGIYNQDYQLKDGEFEELRSKFIELNQEAIDARFDAFKNLTP